MGKFDKAKKRGKEIIAGVDVNATAPKKHIRFLNAVGRGSFRTSIELNLKSIKKLDAIKSELNEKHEVSLSRSSLIDYAISYAIENGIFFKGGFWK